MKKFVAYVISCAVTAVLSVSCKDFDTYRIEGRINGLASSSLYFVPYDEDVNTKIDTVRTDAKGQFAYRGHTKGVSRIVVYMQNGSTWFTVWAKNKESIKVSGNLNQPEMILARGGKINNDISSFKEKNKNLLLKRSGLLLSYSFNNNDTTLYASQKKAEVKNINHSLALKAERMIDSDPSAVSSLVFIQDYLFEGENASVVEKYLSKIKADATKIKLYKKLTDENRRILASSKGAKAPPFSLKSKGKILTLDSYKDKYLLMIFTASWVNQDPMAYERIRKVYKSDRLGMLTVSLDDAAGNWYENFASKNISWDQYVDSKGWNSNLVSLYNIGFLPDNILIDKNKKIIERDIPPYQLKSILDRYLR